jgi:hypothetical protein
MGVVVRPVLNYRLRRRGGCDGEGFDFGTSEGREGVAGKEAEQRQSAEEE